MVKNYLEGKEIKGVKEAKYYEEYLKSYEDILEFYTYSLLSESLNSLSTLNRTYYVTDSSKEYTLVDSYKSYLTRGKLFELANTLQLYIDTPEDSQKYDYNVISLRQCLLDKGKDLETLKDFLISSFIDSLMDRVIYVLSNSGTSIIISPKYDMETVTN